MQKIKNTIKEFFKDMPRDQIQEFIKANPQVIEQLKSEMNNKITSQDFFLASIDKTNTISAIATKIVAKIFITPRFLIIAQKISNG